MIRIAVCGLDGSGKSTLIGKLCAFLKNENKGVSVAKVPFICKRVMLDIYGDLDNMTDAQELIKRTGMAFDFVQYHCAFEYSCSNDCEIIICDRYDVDFKVLDDVYELPDEYKDNLNRIYDHAPPVSLYIYLRAEWKTAAERLDARGDRHTNENDEILRGMQEGFDRHFAHIGNSVCIDASLSEAEILEIAIKQVQKLM